MQIYSKLRFVRIYYAFEWFLICTKTLLFRFICGTQLVISIYSNALFNVLYRLKTSSSRCNIVFTAHHLLYVDDCSCKLVVVIITISVSIMRDCFFWRGKDNCVGHVRTPSKSDSVEVVIQRFSFVAQRSRFCSTTQSSPESRVAHRGPGRDDSVMLAVVNPIVTNYRESPFNCSGPRRDHADEEVKASSRVALTPWRTDSIC